LLRAHVPVLSLLLVCGTVSSLLYVAMNVLGAMQWEDYRVASQAVSELGAIGAPSRPLWVTLGIVYQVLMIAFGLGVWASGDGRRPLRPVGGLLIAYGAVGLLGPFVPIHLRGEAATLTDAMHIMLTVVTVLLMFATIAFGAAAVGPRLRIYSIVTIVLLVLGGVLAFSDASRLAAQQPTPWLGVTERINIGVFLLWVVVLATALLRLPGQRRAAEFGATSP
jgi:hypothetical membrane protein